MPRVSARTANVFCMRIVAAGLLLTLAGTVAWATIDVWGDFVVFEDLA